MVLDPPSPADLKFAERWGSRWRCWLCWKLTATIRPSVIRVFSGVYCSGWAACDEHAQAAIFLAMAPINDRCAHENYRVSAYRVTVDERGWPQIHIALWSARAKAKPTSVATGGSQASQPVSSA